MRRRDFMGIGAAAGIGALAASPAGAAEQKGAADAPLLAGFARVCITPPLGTKMMGFGGRDMEHGCDSVHDDLYVRALYLRQGEEQALIMGYDLCFLGREETDRIKGALGRRFDILPRQSLLNTSHNHVGPSVGTWYSAGYEVPERDYVNQLERASVQAALAARDAAREATLAVGVTQSKLPVHRRKRDENGVMQNRPNFDVKAYDRLPVCMVRDMGGAPICLMFSTSCHPSMMQGHAISAEFPGAIMAKLDADFGAPASLFLQGVGGDAKPLVIGRDSEVWIPGTWELMDEAGEIVAGEVRALLAAGLQDVPPALCSATAEMHWKLQPLPERSFYEGIVSGTAEENRAKNVQYMWAVKQLERLDKGLELPSSMPLTMQGVQLGHGARLAAMEGESVGGWGDFIDAFYGGGFTMPLGYANGQGAYLPVTSMIDEGGYEVISYWEYDLPSGFAKGMEEDVRAALERLSSLGVA